MLNMIVTIVKDITTFFSIYAPVGFGLALVAACIYRSVPIIFQWVSGKKEKAVRRISEKETILVFFLVWYLYIVLGITMLSRSESKTRQASFELFRTFQNTFFARKQVYENVIMFVPLAVILYGLSKRFRRLPMVLFTGIMGSLFIEIMQWVTQTGWFELDDILTNTMGMLFGFLLCAAAEKVIDCLRWKYGRLKWCMR